MHPKIKRTDNLTVLIKMRAKGKTFNELEDWLRLKGYSDQTVRSYMRSLKVMDKNPNRIKHILKPSTD